MNNIEMQGENILLKLKEKENNNFSVTSWKEKNLYEILWTTDSFYSVWTLFLVSEHTWDKIVVDWQEYKIVKPWHILAIYKNTNEWA